jgi:hypothetical protein
VDLPRPAWHWIEEQIRGPRTSRALSFFPGSRPHASRKKIGLWARRRAPGHEHVRVNAEKTALLDPMPDRLVGETDAEQLLERSDPMLSRAQLRDECIHRHADKRTRKWPESW